MRTDLTLEALNSLPLEKLKRHELFEVIERYRILTNQHKPNEKREEVLRKRVMELEYKLHHANERLEKQKPLTDEEIERKANLLADDHDRETVKGLLIEVMQYARDRQSPHYETFQDYEKAKG